MGDYCRVAANIDQCKVAVMQHTAVHCGQGLSLMKVQTAKHHGHPSRAAAHLQTTSQQAVFFGAQCDTALHLSLPASTLPPLPLSRKYKFSCPDRCHGVSSLPSSRN